CSLCYNVAWVF
nr:immunoglobulin light chain junction region [Macaca mulatta]MPN68228.1 immunoglobulin light chain junction region [Macaca mulatta]MPN69113.1 immunoglobulin light chain junction region [Macaca mulatta]